MTCSTAPLIWPITRGELGEVGRRGADALLRGRVGCAVTCLPPRLRGRAGACRCVASSVNLTAEIRRDRALVRHRPATAVVTTGTSRPEAKRAAKWGESR